MNDAFRPCPLCGAATGAEATCPACGLELDGSEAATLRDLAAQLDTLEGDLVRVSARRQDVA
ncbi:MAG: hypothetical protein QOI55_1527, partial [Actinomycetota bacterium]|nr:hypothetical protein [Actinomycetota bacterium]